MESLYRVVAKAVNANIVADTPLVVPLPPGSPATASLASPCSPPSRLAHRRSGRALQRRRRRGRRDLRAAGALRPDLDHARTAGNAIDLTLALAAATFFTAATLYFRITTAQGSAATVDVILHIQPYD